MVDLLGGVAYHGDGETLGGDSLDDFVDLVGVDAEAVEGAWGG